MEGTAEKGCVAIMFLSHADPRAPKYWMNEVSGFLRPAIEAYLNHTPMSSRDIAAMRSYLCQWIDSPVWDDEDRSHWNERLSRLRKMAKQISNREDISLWIHLALEDGIDPL
jgi:hypothetical protein